MVRYSLIYLYDAQYTIWSIDFFNIINDVIPDISTCLDFAQQKHGMLSYTSVFKILRENIFALSRNVSYGLFGCMWFKLHKCRCPF